MASKKDDAPYRQVGERLEAMRTKLGKTQKMMSFLLGLGATTWQRLENGANAPSGETLLKIAQLGFNPGWILTGSGGMTLDAGERIPIDEEFMARISVAVADTYQQTGYRVSDAAKGIEIHRMLTAVLAGAQHPDEFGDQLEIEKKRLRRRLIEAQEKPGSGKASA